MRFLMVSALALSISAAFACGGSQPAPNPPVSDADGGGAAPNASNASTGSGVSTASTGAADGGAAATSVNPSEGAKDAKKEPSFDDLPMDKKVDLMMTKVVPNVGKVFKDHDGKKYAKFGCATCHGPGKKKEAPSKFLPKLVFKDGGFDKLQKQKPEMVKFMSEKVLPAMAEALGEHPMDAKTGKGFGCNGCHAVEK